MKVFARAGLRPRGEAYARLFVNNEFAGVYVIVEPIDRTFVTRYSAPPKESSESGGYLYEYNWVREWGSSISALARAYAELFEPEYARDRIGVALYQPLETLARASTDTPGRQFEQRGALIDLRSCEATLPCSGPAARSTASSATGA
jgi:hypothetical protein